MKITRLLSLSLIFLFSAGGFAAEKIKLSKDSRIALIGGNLGSRMVNYGHFETELHIRFPELNLYIRNMCDAGNTPGFRPHSARKQHFAFPGAEKFNPNRKSNAANGFNETDDEWMTRHKIDIVIGFFGFTESFRGQTGADMYRNELKAFIDHSMKQNYDGKSAPQLAIVSPIAFQDLSAKYDYPNGQQENVNLQLYTNIMKEVCAEKSVLFVDTFTPSKEWFKAGNQLTIDGSQLNDDGYKLFSKFTVEELFGGTPKAESHRKAIHDAVVEKNWYWINDFKIPNGVHVYGRRYKPFGPANYPYELNKIREMTAIRDQAAWAAANGKKFDVAALDAKTSKLPEVKTNYRSKNKKNGTKGYLYGEQAVKKITPAKGYKIELFASEVEFPNLANPVQMSFDNKGRLWVAVMPSYPHWKPGDPKPDDKLLILEDTDGDGKADKETIFARGLTLPIGFEFAPEGVYLSQASRLVLLKDTDGDDKADETEIILSGFDDHDTHHNIGAFSTDPSGAIFMAEGIFLNTNVETSYGTVRGTNGGFYRFNPQRRRLERALQVRIPNPWGIACDEWGQMYFLHTSGPTFTWMTPYRVKAAYGVNIRTKDLLTSNKVRPTSGLEFVSSRHFPDEVQGDALICNNIGFLGAKQHQMVEQGTGFTTKFRHDLFSSADTNFRPVDLEFAPDGSLYFVDWHNVLIGHMQHNARDPFRDHKHGRIYRVTYPSRPLVKPAKVDGAPIAVLLDNLKLPEYRTRYRSRREIREHKKSEVLPAVTKWVASLDKADPRYEHHVLEALWVTWAMNRIDPVLLDKCLSSKDHKVRAAATNVVHYVGHQIPNQTELLIKSAKDSHGRVNIEAVTAASWMAKKDGLKILEAFIEGKNENKLDDYLKVAYTNSLGNLKGQVVIEHAAKAIKTHLKGSDRKMFVKGKEIYEREGHCMTCHQANGLGLPDSGFPPLANTKWVLGDEERLIKITLKGLMGPIEVKGKKYPGQVPMTPFGGLLSDDDIAAVLTYVRNSFGNKAAPVKAETVKKVRAEVKGKTGFYSPEELLKAHPHK